MLIKLKIKRPYSCTLESGESFYMYPGKPAYISQQDWFLSKQLQGAKKSGFFRVLEAEDTEKQEENKPNKKNIKRQDRVYEESRPKPHQQPEMASKVDKLGQIIDTRPLTREEQINKVAKKKIKVKKYKKGREIK